MNCSIVSMLRVIPVVGVFASAMVGGVSGSDRTADPAGSVDTSQSTDFAQKSCLTYVNPARAIGVHTPLAAGGGQSNASNHRQ